MGAGVLLPRISRTLPAVHHNPHLCRECVHSDLLSLIHFEVQGGGGQDEHAIQGQPGCGLLATLLILAAWLGRGGLCSCCRLA